LKSIEEEDIIGKDDPIEPIINIMKCSLMKYDYGIFKEGLRIIQNSTIYILIEEKNIDLKEK
jgi:hypothetical protein